SVFNSHGKPFVALTEAEGGGGLMEIYNSLEKSVVTIQADKTNKGLVAVSDQNGILKNALSAH
ncbi:MAG: hypothetical protein ABSA26_16255, partial [Thermoguttaceae bacterium]